LFGMTEINNHLFVYGTLQSPDNAFADYLAKHCSNYAEGCFKGQLYDIGEYPGAVLSPFGDDFVYGTIFLMDDAVSVFKVLDDYEGFGEEQPQPNEFVRKLVDVVVNDTVINCWVYLYDLPVNGLRRIESGRYL